MIGYIYITTNLINGKQYIGRKTRRNKYKPESYIGSGVTLKRAIKKYGKENFKKEVLEDNIKSFEELCEKEIFYIKKYNAAKSKKFYNITDGGKDRVNNLDKDYLKKFSDARKGKKLCKDHVEKLRKAHKNQINENLYKSVLQYSLNNEFIKEFSSCTEATLYLNKNKGSSSQITKAYRFSEPIWGFYWKYKEENKDNNFIIPERNNFKKYKGVSWNRIIGKYMASINIDKKKYYLGSYNTPEEAYNAYINKKLEVIKAISKNNNND